MVTKQSSSAVSALLIALVSVTMLISGCAKDNGGGPAPETVDRLGATPTPTPSPTPGASATPTPTPTPSPTPSPTASPGPTPVAGSATFSSAGSYTFTVPNYQTLTVKIWGGGGGGGGCGRNAIGWPGGTTTFDTLTATGGSGGFWGWDSAGMGGAGGMGTGGDHNNNGAPGLPGYGYTGGNGACDPSGNPCIPAQGGQQQAFDGGYDGQSALFPGAGGGGGGGSSVDNQAAGGGGGAGGYASRTYIYPALPPGRVINFTVGGGGWLGWGNSKGGVGRAGQVVITWQ